MAAYFVDSVTGVGGTGDGSSWANAFLTIALALARPIAAGDTLWVSDIHNESTASAVTWTFPGTGTSPNFIYCVDHTKASPGTGDLKTTGKATTTGASGMTIAGNFYWYGVNLSMGTGGSNANFTLNNSGSFSIFENCNITCPITSGGILFFGSSTNGTYYIEFRNVTVKYGATNYQTRTFGLRWINSVCVDPAGSLPATWLTATGLGRTLIEGCDVSAVTGTLVAQSYGAPGDVVFKDCKINAGATIVSGTAPTWEANAVLLIRSDSGATNYRVEKHNNVGDLTTETTIIRTGGASDGTTGFSRKVVTASARVSWTTPFIAPPIAIWNDKTGVSVTLTVHATSNLAAGAFPNNDDIWIEAEYLGTSGNPQGSFVNNTKANNLATGSAYTNDSASWAGSPAGGTFAMSVTFTPQQKGYIYVYPKCAKTSTTFYIDPLAVLS